MSTIGILLCLFLGGLLTNALFLWIGTKCARIPHITYPWAVVGAFVIGLVVFPVYVFFLWVSSEWPDLAILAGCLEFGVGLGVTLLSLKFLFRTSLLRAFFSWLPTLVAGVGLIAVIYLAVKPYIVAAYIVPTHAMAPTLLGPHQQGVCPHCGHSTTIALQPGLPGFDTERVPDDLGMCQSCQQAGVATNVGPTAYQPDRFMVNKLLTPRRWDLVVCRSLENPATLFVKRLVGLPGEEVMIKKGSVWINGAKQEFPADIAKLTWVVDSIAPEKIRDQGERSWQLGEGEVFVIGDFSLRSSDSRDFGALPAKNLEGVVTIIYWPLSRWRLIR